MIARTPVYELMDHTADLGIRVKGKDLIDLFENGGRALLNLMVRVRSRGKSVPLSLKVEGNDLPDLMVRWLSEILYLFEGEKVLATSIKINSLSSTGLEATLRTSPYDPRIHEIIREIKAVTYHGIEVIEKKGLWEASIIFDL